MELQADLDLILSKLRQCLPALVKTYQVRSLGVFGSYVRNQQQGRSDLDILVMFDEPPGLFRYLELENYLTDLLGIQVDLVMQDALKPQIAERVLDEVIAV